MENKLKLCPFCGSKDVVLEDNGVEDDFEDWCVFCNNCYICLICPGKEPGAVATKKDAIKAWNKRYFK